jgi:hypothetical protein
MSLTNPGAEPPEPQIADLPVPSVSSDEAAQVKAGGEILLQPFTGAPAIDGTTMHTRIKTTVNGETVIDGVAMTFGNESFTVGGSSSV